MFKLEIFDPPMCCSTGICGSSTDPTLVNFASDLEWLKEQGIEVVRHGLSFEPNAFVKYAEVEKIMNSEGNSSLPIIVFAGKVVLKGRYPYREKLAKICGVEFNAEQAPPIHREENCCCGEDCDCSISYFNKNEKSFVDDNSSECDCTNAAAEDNCICGAQCECRNMGSGINLKKIIFVIILMFILGFAAAKFWGKAGAATGFFPIECISSLKQISSNYDAVLIYIPVNVNEEINDVTKKTLSSAKSALKSKNVNAALYQMDAKSIEYYQLASRTQPPAILTIVRGKGSDYVSRPITQAKLLQSYDAALRGGN